MPLLLRPHTLFMVFFVELLLLIMNCQCIFFFCICNLFFLHLLNFLLMKKIVFCSVFFGLLLTLMSFTRSKSNLECPDTPPSSILMRRANSCSSYYNVTIRYPVGVIGDVFLYNSSGTNIGYGFVSGGYPNSVTFQILGCSNYTVAIGNLCQTSPFPFITPCVPLGPCDSQPCKTCGDPN
jgi:hypothetical protein